MVYKKKTKKTKKTKTKTKKIQTSPAQRKRKFTLLDDDGPNDDRKLMSLFDVSTAGEDEVPDT